MAWPTLLAPCRVVIGPNSTVQWTSDERVGEDVVSIPMRILQQNPGRYYIQVCTRAEAGGVCLTHQSMARADQDWSSMNSRR